MFKELLLFKLFVLLLLLLLLMLLHMSATRKDTFEKYKRQKSAKKTTRLHLSKKVAHDLGKNNSARMNEQRKHDLEKSEKKTTTFLAFDKFYVNYNLRFFDFHFNYSKYAILFLLIHTICPCPYYFLQFKKINQNIHLQKKTISGI